MDLTIVWSAVLTFVLGFFGWVLRGYVDDLKRITILLNRTREEIAREYVTKNDARQDMNQVLDRLKQLDDKLDRLLENRSRSSRSRSDA
jgi:hypothetical protein